MFYYNVSAILITEIMYAPAPGSSNEWIELYNDQDQDIDLAALYIKVGTTTKNYDRLSEHSLMLKSGERVILSKNLDNFKSVYDQNNNELLPVPFYSLSNSGSVIHMQNDGGESIMDPLHYESHADSGTKSNGGTWQYEGGRVYHALASPWKILDVNDLPEGNSEDTDNSNSNNNENEESETDQNPKEEGSTATNFTKGYTHRTYVLGDLKMITPKDVWTVAGADTEFFVKSINSKNKTLPVTTYWSYGDGAESYGASTTHRYYNKGKYIAFVEVQLPSAYGSERINVHVALPDVIIKEVGEDYIIIKNNNEEDLDLGGFMINSDQGYYILPRHLIIAKKSELIIDGRIFNFQRLSNVKILSPNQDIISKYEPKHEINSPLLEQIHIEQSFTSQSPLISDKLSVTETEKTHEIKTLSQISLKESRVIPKNQINQTKIDESIYDKTGQDIPSKQLIALDVAIEDVRSDLNKKTDNISGISGVQKNLFEVWNWIFK